MFYGFIFVIASVVVILQIVTNQDVRIIILKTVIVLIIVHCIIQLHFTHLCT